MVFASVLYGLGFGIGIGVSDVISAGLTRRLGVLRSVFLLQLFSGAGMSVYALVSGELGGLDPSDWALMGGITALVALFYLGFFKALQIGPIALVAPIVAAHSAVVVGLAVIALGESVSGWQIAAIGATFGGVALASVDWRALRTGRAALGMGVALAILVCIAAGFWQFAIGALARDMGWFAPIYLTRIFLVAMLSPVVAVRRDWPWRGMSWRLTALVAAAALVESLAMFAFTRGSQVGVLWIVAAASTAYPVIPIAGGIVLFRERLTLIQYAGLFVVLVGLLALSLLP